MLICACDFFQPGRRRIVWAYHYTSDDIENDWQKHTEKGFHEISLLKVPKERPEVDYIRTEPPTTGATVIAASIIGNLLLIIIVGIFLY